MSNLKISQLPVATTPLAGTELAPIVQSGITDQTTVQDIADLAINTATVVVSVTGLDTDNTDPKNPIIEIAVDSSNIAGDGTAGNPLSVTVGSTEVAYGTSGTGVLTSDSNFTRTAALTVINNTSGGDLAQLQISPTQIQSAVTDGVATAASTQTAAASSITYNGASNVAGIVLNDTDLTIINNNNAWLFPTSDGTASEDSALKTDGAGLRYQAGILLLLQQSLVIYLQYLTKWMRCI